MAKDIKLLSIFFVPHADTQSQGTPSAVELNIRRGVKNLQFSTGIAV